MTLAPHIARCARPGCTVTLAPNTAPGRQRKWCSERCRKSQYDLVCVDCGGRVDGTTPGGMADRDEPRCNSCSQRHYRTWTRAAIVCVIQDWADAHGGAPPSANEWNHENVRAGDGVPCVNHVRVVFGTWNQAIVAAGFEPHARGPVSGYTVLTAEQRRECADRYQAGESSVRIAYRLRCSSVTVLRWVRHHGVPVRPLGAPR